MCKNKKEQSEFYNTYRKIRKDWGEIKPVTQIIPNKKKYSRKQKHKESYTTNNE